MSRHAGPIKELVNLYDTTTAAAAAEAEILEAAGTDTTAKTPAKVRSAGRDTDNSPYPSVDIFAAPSHWTLLVAVPGVKQEDVSLCWDDRSSTLAIRGNVATPGGYEEEEMGRMVLGERKVGAFERAIRLPPGEEEEGGGMLVDGERMTSKLEDGVMIVTMPKTKPGE
ncbi:uncharacterized protein B0T15DRAFT_518320 [Chaetomium strumarium]|uniref:SHSP domain-containing protein n=1 Tax=Chaetomium strumarium TaxID=1170767 RepID=A0AAJ0M676_9PEZI|nr:hypothetical protein B0T15DRAFT_518320 [Chaetomium strumarium]